MPYAFATWHHPIISRRMIRPPQRTMGRASPGGHSAAMSRPTKTPQASRLYAPSVGEEALTWTAFCSDDWGASPCELPPSRRPSICVPVMRVARSCSRSISCLAPPHDSVLCKRVNCQGLEPTSSLLIRGSICVPVMRVEALLRLAQILPHTTPRQYPVAAWTYVSYPEALCSSPTQACGALRGCHMLS